MQVPAQSAKEALTNQPLSAETLVLLWIYSGLRGVLRTMRYGDGLPKELQNQLQAELLISQLDEHLDPDSDTREEIASEVEKSLNRSITIQGRKAGELVQNENLSEIVLEDWMARSKQMRPPLTPQPRRLARLIRGEGTEMLREYLNNARAIWGARFGFTRKEFQRVFLTITTSNRFPKSADAQIEFLSRALAGVAVGLQPNTARRKIADVAEWCHSCQQRPAIVDVEVGSGNLRPWCGDCAL